MRLRSVKVPRRSGSAVERRWAGLGTRLFLANLAGRSLPVLAWATVAVLVAPAVGSAQADGGEAPLDDEYQEWLDLVAPLISDEEREFFLSLDRDFRRRAFMDEFWEVRDPDPDTPLNELKVRWLSRSDEAQRSFGSIADHRSVFFLLNGPPTGWVLRSGRTIRRCFHKSNELEVWFYSGSERTANRFPVIFQKRLGRDAFYELWLPGDRLSPRQRSRLPTTEIALLCAEEFLPLARRVIQERGVAQYLQFIQEMMDPGDPPAEWLATFAAMTADAPGGAGSFSAEVEWEFVGRYQSRTVVQGVLAVPAEGLGERRFGEETLHHFIVTGEVVLNDRLFENFRYRFELSPPHATASSEAPTTGDDAAGPESASGAGAVLPLVLTRYLRSGSYDILLKVEDLYGQRFAVLEERLEVPPADDLEEVRPRVNPADFPWLSEAVAAVARGEYALTLMPPSEETIHTGMVRFHARTAGDIDRVAFYLDDRQILTKRRPPYSVELNLGSVAGTHRVRAVAYTGEEEVASDEVSVNRGGQRFRVRVVEPRSDRSYRESVYAVVDVETPDEEPVERLELFLNEERVATLYQPPFVQTLKLPEAAKLTFLRAVATLEDGSSTEDVAFINAPDHFEEIDVQYVEVFAGIYDKQGRPVSGLEREAFRVLEDGEPQQVRRFEYVDDLPIHAGLLIDTSASMEESLADASAAALSFVEQAIRPKDRVTLMSFATRPSVEIRFTNDTERVAQVLSALKALGSTALYDSLVFAMHYFDGIKGQKALLVLSDGEDETSSFDFASTLEVARRAGVVVYAIGLNRAAKEKEARKALRQLAEETGGQAYFVDGVSELGAIYDSIQKDLRSRYLLGYQSTSDKDPSEFRVVKVEVDRKDTEIRAMSGYYP